MGKLRRCWPLLVLALAAGAALWWRTHTTSAEYRLRKGLDALERNDPDAAAHRALQLEAAGALDHARLLSGQILMAEARARGSSSSEGRSRYSQALALFNKIEAQGEIRRRAISLCGQCHLQLGELAEAERVFTYLIKQNPDDLDGQRGLAATAFDLGALDRAVDHCREWARLAPTDGRPHRFMAMIFKDLSQLNDAIPSYRAALERTLATAVQEEVRLELAECLIKRKEFAQAREALEPCSPPPQLMPKLLIMRAECSLGLGETDRARSEVAKARKIHPDFPDALRVRANLDLQAGDAQSAAALLEKAVQLEPANHACRHLLAQAYSSLNRPADAKEQNRLVKEIQGDLNALSKITKEVMENPKDASLHLRMAELYQKLHMPEMAARNRRLAETLAARPR
jgi:tetratricopeptide (TPR) repeat protein